MTSPVNQSEQKNSTYSFHDDLESFKKNVDIFFLVVMGSIVFCKSNNNDRFCFIIGLTWIVFTI